MNIEVSSYEEFCRVIGQEVTRDNPMVIVVDCKFKLDSGEMPTLSTTSADEKGNAILAVARAIIWAIGRVKGRPGLEKVVGRATIAQCRLPRDWMGDLAAQSAEMVAQVKQAGVAAYVPIDEVVNDESFRVRLQSASLRPFVKRLRPEQNSPNGSGEAAIAQ